MPIIKSSTDLRNNYNEISILCHQQDDAIFITKNGRGDLAVMSIEAYNMLCELNGLSKLLEESRGDIAEGRTRSHEEVISDVRRKYQQPEHENTQGFKVNIGFLKGKVPEIPDSFFEPLPEEDLQAWGL